MTNRGATPTRQAQTLADTGGRRVRLSASTRITTAAPNCRTGARPRQPHDV